MVKNTPQIRHNTHSSSTIEYSFKKIGMQYETKNNAFKANAFFYDFSKRSINIKK